MQDPPGTIARIRNGKIDIEPYWELRFEDSPDDVEALARRVRDTLRDSVHAWMMSDVPEGVFLSKVKDTETLSSWGRIRWHAEVGANASVRVATRSGNTGAPDNTWSEWSPLYTRAQGEEITSPRASFLQIKAVLTGPSHYESMTDRGTKVRIYGKTAVLSGPVDVKPPNGELYRVRTLEVYTQNSSGVWQMAQKESVRIPLK